MPKLSSNKYLAQLKFSNQQFPLTNENAFEIICLALRFMKSINIQR